MHTDMHCKEKLGNAEIRIWALKLSFPVFFRSWTEQSCASIFKQSLEAIGTEKEQGYRTGPPGYIDWRNWFLGIDS
jgi:hypothetical protein